MNKQNALKIIQITDTHLTKDNSLLFGVNTNLAFNKIMQKIESQLNDTDFIILTGDITQDESFESYQMIADSLNSTNKDIYWIPGNHDVIEKMQSVFAKYKNFHQIKKLSTKHWDFIFLDSTRAGEVSGYLSATDLSLISTELNTKLNKSVALIMHHHPIPVNTPLIDKYMLKNNEEFLKIANTGVDLVICGHVHENYSIKFGHICVESAPATCLQFKKGTSELEIAEKMGCKIYYFSEKQYRTETIWL